ncbi:MAG: hypothetical protein L6R40_002910 [Gallowayella cf. fulva]|nr:MAG: hypothetical protein L6R40_002910 [Xanthomendoza cf. fulva]
MTSVSPFPTSKHMMPHLCERDWLRHYHRILLQPVVPQDVGMSDEPWAASTYQSEDNSPVVAAQGSSGEMSGHEAKQHRNDSKTKAHTERSNDAGRSIILKVLQLVLNLGRGKTCPGTHPFTVYETGFGRKVTVRCEKGCRSEEKRHASKKL